MNELIEKFAIDCSGQMVWDFPKDPEEFTFTRDELAKFAELIVEECIDIVAAGGEFVSRPKLVERLQRHFGVE